MAWTLVPCLVSLRNEFNQLAPGRDKTSDGSVGDTSHATEPSDHNPDETGVPESTDLDHKDEVHAIDVDKDLNKTGWSMQRCADVIVGRHRAGVDNRLKYVIWNHRIASASHGWAWRAYGGVNPHDHHAHFSASYDSAREADTRPWGLLAQREESMPLETADLDLITRNILGTKLGASGPTVATAMQTSYQNTVKLVAAATAEAQRDTTIAAILAGMQSAISALASAGGALTPAQIAALTEQVRQAAIAAGEDAVATLEAKVDALSHHLGGDATA